MLWTLGAEGLVQGQPGLHKEAPGKEGKGREGKREGRGSKRNLEAKFRRLCLRSRAAGTWEVPLKTAATCYHGKSPKQWWLSVFLN